MKNELIELHKKYSEVAKLQRGLPQKRGSKDYSELENKISTKANSLRVSCIDFLRNPEHLIHKAEVQNILEGACQIMSNPYMKLTTEINLD